MSANDGPVATHRSGVSATVPLPDVLPANTCDEQDFSRLTASANGTMRPFRVMTSRTNRCWFGRRGFVRLVAALKFSDNLVACRPLCVDESHSPSSASKQINASTNRPSNPHSAAMSPQLAFLRINRSARTIASAFSNCRSFSLLLILPPFAVIQGRSTAARVHRYAE